MDDLVEIKDPEIDVEQIMQDLRVNIARQANVSPWRRKLNVIENPIGIDLYLSEQKGLTQFLPLALLRRKLHEVILFYLDQVSHQIIQFRDHMFEALAELDQQPLIISTQDKAQTANLSEQVEILTARVSLLEETVEALLAQSDQDQKTHL